MCPGRAPTHRDPRSRRGCPAAELALRAACALVAMGGCHGQVRSAPDDAGVTAGRDGGHDAPAAADSAPHGDALAAADGDSPEAAVADAGGGDTLGGGADATVTTPLPDGAVVIAWSDWALEAAAINARTAGSGPGVQDDWDAVGTHIWLTRSEEEGTEVVSVGGMPYLKTTIADGRNWQGGGYDRAEYSIGYEFLDGQKYVMEWRGLIPQAVPSVGVVTFMMQVHMDNDTCPSFEVDANEGRLVFRDCMDPQVTNTDQCANAPQYDLGSLDAFVDVPTTLRLTLVSSLANGYVKFEQDGVMVFERSGRTTVVAGGDWLKDGTLYDWGTYWVSPAEASRGRSYSLLTEHSRIWLLP
jgi:hypothetical protein